MRRLRRRRLQRTVSWTARWDGCLLLTENYPQLRSSDQFMRLQDELAGTENRISVARRRYNEAIQDYNTFIRQFPNSIWAGMAGYHTNDAYFKASPAAEQVPNVKF